MNAPVMGTRTLGESARPFFVRILEEILVNSIMEPQFVIVHGEAQLLT